MIELRTTSSALVLAAAWIAALASCAASPAPAEPARVIAPSPPTAALPVAPSPPPDPPLSVEDARARAKAWKSAWSRRPDQLAPGAPAELLADSGIDEPTVRRVLEALTRDCLAEATSEAPACAALGPRAGYDPQVRFAFELAGEVADTTPGANDTVRLLVRLDARGAWRADFAIERVLERRMIDAPRTCAAPTPQEVEVARASLVDVRVVAPGGAPRAPTEVELSDLAYLRVALRHAGPEVGTAREDETSPPLAKGSPEHARRDAHREAMHDALLDGDVARHAAATEAYLRMLGYPGPIRVAEETDERWGGKGFSYALRLWARSAEILGHYELAEPLHRRAAPGGGMCGTATPSVLVEQIQGAIRAAEMREGCRPVVAERLFAPGGSLYGPTRLKVAGFDLERLYRAGLLVTTDAVDAGTRIRAMAGYADVAGRAAVPRLLDIAEQGDVSRRVAALRALQQLLASDGHDPCRPFNVGGLSAPGVGERYVASIRSPCEGRLDDATMARSIQRAAALATHPDPGVREALAGLLGATGSPRARAPLRRLARDTYDAGGTVCTRKGDGAERCEPDRPVRRAAEEGLERLDFADRMRRLQAAYLREAR